ncbi:FkbM family methyltransferase [Dyadobacter sp. LHD-138]|uniref:FkbM family methyltransferase n=1 Tax=Dyadobacter sp. LHD-138 TaxID=3071413 RepID=UPI0027DF72DC|nr:FkbM family methyltransferase [Dyadobacter sp. LHD-138]MDQ6482601.1 FkbM family methyltransferase [Dyadobacter sp. LHD-138]
MLENLKKVMLFFSQLGIIKGSFFLIGKALKNNKTINLANIKHSIHLRPGTSDDKVFAQIFVYKEYDINLDFEPQTIIDGGANIGLSCVYFKNRFPDAKIIAIEPDIENVELLNTNIKNYDNIYVKHKGLWPTKTCTKLTDKYGFGKWGMIVEECNNDASLHNEINTITIDDIMNEFHLEYIDLLKLDIESAEKQLFSGDYMTWLPKTKVIIIELHDWITDGCSKPFFSAINQAFNNYSFGQIGENTIIVNRDLVPSKTRST